MEHRNTGPFPNDVTLWLLKFALLIVRKFFPLRILFCGLWIVLLAISPAFPNTPNSSATSRRSRAGLWWGAGLAFVFCFVVTLAWSRINGTFLGTDQTRIYFKHDFGNLIEYFFLCPAYVGLSVHLVALLAPNWERLSRPQGFVIKKTPRLPHAPMGFGVFLILFLSSMGTVNYIREVLDPSKFPKIGWWVDHVAPDGSRVLSSLGVYYALLNCGLLAVCVMAALAFVSLFLLCIGFGQLIAQQPITSRINVESIRGILSGFNEAYVVLKFLAATLVLNVYTWKWEAPRGSTNFIALNAVLLLFGLVLIRIPRYYIELEWFDFRERRAHARGEHESLECDDMRRSVGVKFASAAADILVLSGFAESAIHHFI